MVKENMKLNAYKGFFRNGIWSINDIEYLKNKEIITEEEYNEITATPATYTMDTRIVKTPYRYEVWDKSTPINGVEASKVIEDMSLQNARDIILVMIGDRVIEVSDADVLRINNDISLDIDVNEVGEIYATKLEEERNAPQINLEEVQAGLRILSDVKQEDKVDNILAMLTEIRDLLRDRR